MSTILIGVDSSARSEDAVALGRRLARAGTAEVVVAAVTPLAHPNRDEAHLTVRRMSGLLAGVEPERIRTGVVAAPSPPTASTSSPRPSPPRSSSSVPPTPALSAASSPGSTGERLLYGSPCAVAVAPARLPDARATRRSRGSARPGTAHRSRARRWPPRSAPRARSARGSRSSPSFGPDTFSAPAIMGGPSYASCVATSRRRCGATSTRSFARPRTLVATDRRRARGPARGASSPSTAQQLDLLFVGSRGYGPAARGDRGGTSGPLMQPRAVPGDRAAARRRGARRRPVRAPRRPRPRHQPRADAAALGAGRRTARAMTLPSTAASATISTALTTHHWQTACNSASSTHVR